ncbi:MAG TPA: hypothetical protein VJT14_14840 [Candidatus Dormibacteraeota bacterium]|nr:hypothetical protein [Candidatus Dormibacteraeota bacterium]
MINRRTIVVVVAALIPVFGGTILVLGRNSAGGHPAISLRASAAPTVSVTASPTPTPKPTAAPTPAPPAPTRPPAPAIKPPVITVAYFTTLPPGAALPSDATCARQIASNPWEPRPDNVTANHTNVYAQGFRFVSSYFNDFGPAYGARVTGNYVGTTDQILRWAACKWGFDENTVRAQAVVESDWHQSTLGDCNGGATQPATNGCASVGILQVKGADIPPTEPGTWPAAFTSTAFNVDVAMANRRLCYDGKESWLLQFSPNYPAGDLWGCIGNWFSGRWHDAGAEQYIQKVQAELAAKRWTGWR